MKSIPSHARNKRVSNSRQRKQQHLLDVKIHETKRRERQIRMVAGVIFKIIVFVGIVGGSWFGGKEALRRFLWENPDYFLRDVRFTTDGTLTREQVLTASKIKEGQNIFTVNLGAVRPAIEKLPQVEGAEVQRQLPNRMTITVSERRPVAWVINKPEEDPTSSDRSFLIDARGNVMRTRQLLPEYYHLPIVSGVETENLVPGQRVNSFEMLAALELVRLNADNTRFQVENIDLAKGYCMVVTDQKRARITFGIDNIDAQLSRLNRVLDAVEPMHKELQTVNLLMERNIPVTFVDPDGDNTDPSQNGTPPKSDNKDPRNKSGGPGGDKSSGSGKNGGKDKSSSTPSPKAGATPSQTGKKKTHGAPTPVPADSLKKPFFPN